MRLELDSESSPMRAIVVDDEPLARNLIKSLLDEMRDVSVVGECSDGASACRMIKDTCPDIVFLDIDMPNRNGVTVAKQFVDDDASPYFVIVTAHGKFAIEAFEFAATDFLLKPISKARLAEAVARARHASQRDSAIDLTRKLLGLALEDAGSGRSVGEKSLILKKRDVVRKIQFSDIVWIEAANQYTKVHTIGDVFMRSESLGNFAKQLEDDRFIRIHRSAIVNGHHIERIERNGNGTYTAHMATGVGIPVARSRTSLLPTLLGFSEAASHGQPANSRTGKHAPN